MPIDPRLARMLVAGDTFDCLADILIIVSALAVQDVRERPINKHACRIKSMHYFVKKIQIFILFRIVCSTV